VTRSNEGSRSVSKGTAGRPIGAADSLFQWCLVCAGETAHSLAFEKWGYSILRCHGCGLGWTKVGRDFAANELYDRGYFQGEARDGYADYLGSERVLRAEFRHALNHLMRHARGGGRLLEVGCAYGFFLAEAQRYYRTTGLDVSAYAISFARARGLDVHHGVLTNEFAAARGPFDVVAMLDVIEHLEAPEDVLSCIHRALRVGGHLVITTGDWDSLLARVAGRHWRLMTPPQHLFFFSPRTIRHLLTRLGFEILDICKPWKLVPLGLAAFQVANRVGLRVPFQGALNAVGIPVNLFDAMRVIAQKSSRTMPASGGVRSGAMSNA
jgi:SAM-dependent methyltransferase